MTLLLVWLVVIVMLVLAVYCAILLDNAMPFLVRLKVLTPFALSGVSVSYLYINDLQECSIMPIIIVQLIATTILYVVIAKALSDKGKGCLRS
jgi:hypothetical protein